MKTLIIKFLTDSISQEELTILKEWLKKSENQKKFKNYLKVNSKLEDTYRHVDLESAYANILNSTSNVRTKKHVKVKRLYKSVFKYAAIFIAVLGISYVYLNVNKSGSKPSLILPKEVVTLKTSDGNTVVLSNTGEKKITKTNGAVLAIQNNNTLAMQSDASTKEELVYSEINIPFGKRFEIVLSDGTKVHLNAGSKLKFPNNFIVGYDRKVFLEGEAYFDVAKDTEHPFIVDANDIDVRVLGTQFNVSCYKEDEQINTVLVEGSVAVYEKSDESKRATVITPNQAAFWDKVDKKMNISFVNTDFFTSWREGRLRVRNTPFKLICKKIERQYNVRIINNNIKLAEQRYNMHFENENIEDILKTLDESYSIEYEIIDNEIIIN